MKASITVRKSPEEVYDFWRSFDNFPAFMIHLESVEPLEGGRSRWKAKSPGGGTVEWEAEMTDESPSERLAWRSLPGSGVENSGSVRFASAPGDRGTEVHVELRYHSPAGALGRTVARLFGENPNQQVRDDLRRLKQVLEAGEVVRSEGSPEGTRATRQLRQRPARPVERSAA